MPKSPSLAKNLRREISELTARLAEANDTIAAIRSGEVDAIVVSNTGGDRLYTLEGAEHDYRLLIEDMDEGALLLNTEGAILYCNRRFAEMVHLPSERVLGDTVERFLPQTERAGFHARLAGGTPSVKCRGTLLPSEAPPLPIQYSIQPLPSSGGPSVGMVVTDLSDALAHVEQGLRADIMASAQDTVIGVSLDGTILLWNRAAERLLGYASHEVIGQPVSRIMPGDPPDARRRRPSRPSGEYRSPVDTVAVRKDGNEVEVSLGSSPIHDATGTVVGTSLILRDITERKRLERALRESTERFSGAFEFAPIGMALIALDGVWLKVNAALCGIVGYKEAEMLETTFQAITHPDDLELEVADFKKLVGGEIRTYQVNKRYIRKDGQIVWIAKSVSTVTDRAGAPAYCIAQIQDVTLRKQAEEALRDSLARSTRQASALITLTQEGSSVRADLTTALRQVTAITSEALFAGRVGVWLYSQDSAVITCKDLYDASCRRHISGMEIRTADHPTFFQSLCQVPIIDADDARLDPRTSELTEAFLIPLHIGAMLATCLRIDGEVRGLLWCQHLGGPRAWTKDEKSFVITMGKHINLMLDQVQRRQGQDEVTESRTMLQQIINNIPQFVFWKDRQSNYLGCNSLFARTAGLQASEDIVGKSDFDLSWKDLADQYRADDRRVIETGAPKLGYEEKLPGPGGTSRWLRTSKVPLYDLSRKLFGVLGVFEDITVWKQQQQTLEEQVRVKAFAAAVGDVLNRSATLLEGLKGCTDALVCHLDAAFGRIWTLDEENHELVLQASSGMYTNVQGAHYRIPVGQFKIGLIAQERKPHLTNSVIGDPRVPQQEWAKREGMVAFAGYPLLVGDHLLGVVAMFSKQPLSENVLHALQTVSQALAQFIERKRTEEQLKLISSSLEATANGVVITDTEGTIQWVNPAFTALTGYPAEEAIGQNPRVLKSNQHDQRFYKQLWDRVKAGEVWRGELTNKRKDGSLYTEDMSITPIRRLDGTVGHFVAIKQDITGRKKLEAQAGELERLSTLGQLTDGIAHEMKNPLFILSGRLQLLKEKLAHREYGRVSEDFEKIESAATRMEGIADRFSKLVKRPEAELQPALVQDILKQMLDLLAPDLTKSHITVTTALAPDLPAIQADPRHLQEAFMNLIVNAQQAMVAAHGKGTLTVSAAQVQDAGTGRRGDAAKSERGEGETERHGEGERWIEVRIQDDGPGIAPEHRARLFEPFFTTRTDGRGTGMGLWAARTTMRALRGTITCEAEPGKGATFIMRLPVAEAGQEQLRTPV